MVHYAGYTPRFHPSDFHTHTADGVGADWPIDYADLRPYYEQIEAELPVAGQDWPWGDPHRYPHSPAPGRRQRLIVFLRGARARRASRLRVGPVAIPNGRFGNRPHCIYRGFCLQGCKVNAKASPLITHIPDALAHGAEIRPDSHVSRGARRRPHRPGHRGQYYLRRCASTASAPAPSRSPATRIETPRLLLLSATNRYPRRAGQRPRPGRPLPDGAGRAADRRPVRATRSACTRRRRRRSAASSSTRPTRPSPTSAAGRSRPSARCPSPGPST